MSNAALKNAVQQQPKDKYELLTEQLQQHEGEFRKLLSKDVPVDRFIRVIKNAVIANPKLLDADRKSLFTASMKAAGDNLIPDGKEAVLNVYNTKVKKGDTWSSVPVVQYLPMVAGLIKKLYQSGNVKSIDAAAVYEKDDFTYERGDEPKIVHRPYPGDEDPGKVVGAYMIARLTNGEVKREVMFRRDIEKVRAASKVGESGMWLDWYDQAAIKSVIKRGYKQIPSSHAVDALIEADNEVTGFPEPAAGPLLLAEHSGGTPAPKMEIPDDDYDLALKKQLAKEAENEKARAEIPSDGPPLMQDR